MDTVNSAQPLAGGSATSVVRVGNTVHRPAGPWTEAVHGLLRHLELAGFDAAPRLVGFDDRGHEVLTFIDGCASHAPWPAVLRSDHGVAALADLVRRYHTAVSAYRPRDCRWRFLHRRIRPREIICHGDLTTWNVVWRSDTPAGLIDWDFAQPGSPIDDLALAVWSAVPLRDDARCRECGFASPPDRRHRMEVMCRVYGVSGYGEVLDGVARILRRERRRAVTLGGRGIAPWPELVANGLLESNDRDRRWLTAFRRMRTRDGR